MRAIPFFFGLNRYSLPPIYIYCPPPHLNAPSCTIMAELAAWVHLYTRYDDIGHICLVKLTAAEVDEMLLSAHAAPASASASASPAVPSEVPVIKKAHIALIKMALVAIGAVKDVLSLGPLEWLEMVGRGYGARFAPAFLAAG